MSNGFLKTSTEINKLKKKKFPYSTFSESDRSDII